MLTMLLGGLWHGASWNFVIWGGLHGLYLAAHRPFRRSAPRRETGTRLVDVGARAAVFVLVTFTWLFFRSTDFATTQVYLGGLAGMSVGGSKILLPCLALSISMLALDLPQAALDDEHFILRLPGMARALVLAGIILAILFAGGSSEPFIYFQF
jgi:hypothetical protein